MLSLGELFEKSLITGLTHLKIWINFMFWKNLLAGFSYVILNITDIIFVNIELDVVCVYVRHINMSSKRFVANVCIRVCK